MTVSRTALLVIPANNTTLATEMAALLPGYPRQLVARVPRPARTLEASDIPAYAEATLEATEPFVKDRPDLVVYGCTAAGFLAGPAGNKAITERLAERFGCPVVSTADAMVAALEHNDAHHIAVVTPYLKPVNDGLRAYLEQAGIEVDVLSSFECATTAALGAVTEREVLERAIATAGTMHDALFIACSQLPTLGVLGPLRARLGVPVWSSISATAWLAARHAPQAARPA
jgi:maleate cis-trans isomerase